MRRIALIEGNCIELDDGTVIESKRYFYYGDECDLPSNEQVRGIECEFIRLCGDEVTLHFGSYGHIIGRKVK